MSTRRRDALLWLRYAVEDLGQARRMLEQAHFVPRHPAWLAQQAAEKAVKAVLIANDVPFPRTHDLDLLSRLLPEDAAVRSAEADRSRLSEYAVGARYPGDWPDLAEADVHEAVADAERLVEAARRDVAS